MWTSLSHTLKKIIQYSHEGILLKKIYGALCARCCRITFFIFHAHCVLRGKYENLRGLDFSQPIQGMYNVADDRCDYWPSEKKYVYQALEKINFTNVVKFLDVGCGKGYVLYLATKYPFQQICGIEYSQNVFKILEGNIRAFCF
ncbi:class I SAM-dependent methyltransferase [Desulfovibrio sp. ZJ369]|uniref:class I SAM-dependent methyltransferase n=1 Tax=Desulfovibrio sp. ZJ369 TaxID=2709793 RepID=UPI0013EC71C7|nr:class I SAM-dependent methyltransferase [Desulfovibrio sp. ZJ369]